VVSEFDHGADAVPGGGRIPQATPHATAAISPPSWRHDHPGQPARPRPRRPPRDRCPRHRPRHRVSQDHPRAAHPRQPAPRPLAGSPSNPRLHSGPRDCLISSTGSAALPCQPAISTAAIATGRFQGTLPAHPGARFAGLRRWKQPPGRGLIIGSGRLELGFQSAVRRRWATLRAVCPVPVVPAFMINCLDHL
jgi:hypothetical protein